MSFIRKDGRICSQMRPINIKFDALGYASSSVLLEIGQTKVLTSITLQNKVPPFLRGKGTGWLTAEYAMLPCATQKRTTRESSQQQKNSRSVEISRLIGRSLRSITDLDPLGERTIIVDCDVLQANGGTRVACITAASLALKLAVCRWLKRKILIKNILKDSIAGISVGLINDQICLDLDFREDSSALIDFNFILTKSGKIIELQGTAEKAPLDWNDFEQCKNLATKGITNIFKIIDNKIKEIPELFENKQNTQNIATKKTSSFSLGSRLAKSL